MKFTNEFCGRFYFAFDMNGDGLTTVSDIWMLFKNFFLIPSKAIVEPISHLPKIASFFEMDCLTGEGGGGGGYFPQWSGLLFGPSWPHHSKNPQKAHPTNLIR